MEDKLTEIITFYMERYIECMENYNFEQFLTDVANDIIKEMELQDYVNNFKILESYEKNPSSKGCVDEQGNILIFKEGINQDLNKLLEEAPYLSEFEKNMCKSILYIKTVIHELQHEKQKKLLKDERQVDNFETLITMLSKRGNEGEALNSMGYFCLYDIYPTERLAEIHAYRCITRVLDVLENKYDIDKLSSFLKQKAALEEFYEYHRCGLSGPTVFYLKFVCGDEIVSDLKNKIDKSNLSVRDRVLYGFEINREEYEDMVTKYGYYYDRVQTFLKDGNKK